MDKKTFLPLTLSMFVAFFVFFSCKSIEDNSVLKFSIKIDNPTGDSLVIESVLNGELSKPFVLVNGKLKKDIIQIPMGYYRLSDGSESTICFFKPNFDLRLEIDTKEFDESIVYSGNGENENNYLAKKFLLEESVESLNNFGYYASLEEEEFLKLADSLYQLNVQLFDKYKDSFDKDFVKLESANIHIEYLTKLANYESMHCFLTKNQDFRTSEVYPNPFADIDLNDEQLLLVPGYVHFTKLFIQAETKIKLDQGKYKTYFNVHIDLVDSLIQNAKIKEEVAFYIGTSVFSYVEDKEYFYSKLKKMIKNPEYIKEFDERYLKLQKIKYGAVSPTFEMYDINNDLVKLEDFKGKLVYIDVWATWCAPCLQEIPYLDELQTEFKDDDIVFISMCQNDDPERWKATVISNELQGIHIYVEDENNKFLSDYLVSGIPRFILIDKNGLIIDSEALRPSNPSLKVQLQELLKQ